MHEAVAGWISAAAKLLIPGNKVSTVAQKIEEEARAAGYTIGGIQGYICGVDLREQPISAENETKQNSNATDNTADNTRIDENNNGDGTVSGYLFGDCRRRTMLDRGRQEPKNN